MTKNQGRAYLALAGLYSGVNALQLSAVWIVLLELRANPSIASLAVFLYTGTGVVSDISVGMAVGRYGGRRVITVGAATSGLSGIMLFASSSTWQAVAAAAGLGVGASMLVTPILGGVSRSAQDAGQIRVQAKNALVQRVGALLAAMFLLEVKDSSSTLVKIGMSLLLGSILLLSQLIRPDDVTFGPSRQGPGGLAQLHKMATESPLYTSALIANTTTPIFMIFGSSFLISALIAAGQAQMLVPVLTMRELCALVASAAMHQYCQHRVGMIECGWYITSFVGALGLAALPFLPSGRTTILLAGGVHGLAMACGIVLANVWVSKASRADARAVAFGGAMMTSRVAGLGFSLVMAALGQNGVQLGGVVLLVAVSASLVSVAWRSQRGAR